MGDLNEGESSRRTSTVALFRHMDASDRRNAGSIDIAFIDDDFVPPPGAARVLLRIMRKAASHGAADEAGFADDLERLASRAS